MSDVLTVIKPDGGTGTPGERDKQPLTRTQALLSKDEHFQALKGPVLSRAEVNAIQQETEPGYLYLRFEVPGAVLQEFWGHWGKHDKVAFKSGQVTVGASF